MSPQLPPSVANQVDSTEAAGSFAMIPAGLYSAVLKSVKVKDGDKGPYWVWEFQLLDEPYENRLFWNNTSLAESARPFLKRTFDAFGVPASTPTDALCGQWVTLRIGNRTIQDGDRKGETVNSISEVLPYADENGEPTS